MRKKKKTKGFLSFAELLAEETAAFGNCVNRPLPAPPSVRCAAILPAATSFEWGEFNGAMLCRLRDVYALRAGLCPNTTSFYMRTLRSIFTWPLPRGLTRTVSPFCEGLHRHRPYAQARHRHRCTASHPPHSFDDAPALASARDMFIFSLLYARNAVHRHRLSAQDQSPRGKDSHLRHKTGQPSPWLSSR